MLVWSEALELKIDIIDKQHKEIFEEINKLIGSFEEGKEQEQAYEVLCFIEDYVNKHFLMEEFYLKKYEYREFNEHSQMHRAFSKQLTDYKTHFRRSGITKMAAIEMNNFLVEWWNNHIIKVDSRYVEWISTKIKDEPGYLISE